MSAWALLAAAGAQAAPITLGQTSTSGTTCTTSYAYTEIQETSTGGSSYTVPASGGTIVSWSHYANASTKTKLRLKVYRPTAKPEVFTVVGESTLETIAPNQLNTFATDIPVQAGDVLGYTRAANSEMLCLFNTGSPGDIVLDAPSSADPPGANTSFNTPGPDLRVNISAVLETPPGIDSISPASGPTSGGTAVTISGHDFTGATAVSFGGVAASFIVSSDTQITAVSPPSTHSGAVDVSVTTAAGATPEATFDRFTYVVIAGGGVGPAQRRSCVVPKLKGKSLKADRKKLKKADCKLGKVKGPKGKTAKVTKQSRNPGKVLAPGAKVNVKLGA